MFRRMSFPWFILLVIGLLLRYRAPESRAYAHAVIQYNAAYIACLCYVFGTVTTPAPFLLSMALGTLNFLLFEPAIAIPWIVTFTLLIVSFTIGTWIDLVPYAPFQSSSPFVDGKINSAHLLGTTAFVMVIFLFMLSVIGYIFIRWRDREAKLSDMTSLLKKMFGRYLSTEVMTSILDDPSAMELGGERRSVTIMMTDLRGFTALSERLAPEKVVQMLNTYFEVMVEVVLQYNGTINEIIGDALLVIFGAPQEIPDRSKQAIACAIAMQNAMKGVNEQNRKNDLPEVEMGIGLNEAEVIVGNIGSSKRSKYGVVGSGVNMASRIESYTVGGQILISESVRQQAVGLLRIDAQRDVHPKGAKAPLRIYEVGGIAGQYNLALPENNLSFVTLKQHVPIRCTVLDGKYVGKKELGGFIARLSKKSTEVIIDEPINPMTKLKMNLEDVEDELAVKDFYGKVIESSGERQFIHLIRFTAVPPEMGYYFQALRQYVVKREGGLGEGHN
jgi:class 3 adenylate cyclase